MNSIRSYLTIRLLAGFILLLSVASILIYFISKNILESDFDRRLFAKAQAIIASTSQTGERIELDWSNLPQEIGPHGKQHELLEIVDQSGQFLEGRPFVNFQAVSVSGRERYINATSMNGERLRVLSLAFTPAVEEEEGDRAITPARIRKRCVLIVGADRIQLDHSLGVMAGVLGVMTATTSVASFGVLAFSLGRGLRPLEAVGAQVAQIDEQSLEKRIEFDGLPNEILPIATKLNDLLNRLQISFARERQFSADVSHELRTPVAELKTLSEVMLQQTDLAPEVRQGFEDGLAIARQMESLVKMLLEMVRQEEGDTPLQMCDTALEPIVFTTWQKVQSKAKQKDVRLEIASPMHDVVLRTEPCLLSTVLTNLLDNAVEYSPPGSVVDIEFRPSREIPCLIVSNACKNLFSSDVPHLFERFWRKDTARSESEHFGIGLALTKTICGRLGIQIAASLEEESRVRFWLHFANNN
jgi:signal transduction histidine kinase